MSNNVKIVLAFRNKVVLALNRNQPIKKVIIEDKMYIDVNISG